jgi:hypothetical protein
MIYLYGILMLTHFFYYLQNDRAKYGSIVKQFFSDGGYQYDPNRGYPIYAKAPPLGATGRLNLRDVTEQSQNYMVAKGVKPSIIALEHTNEPLISRLQVLKENAAKKKVDEDNARFV